MKFWLISSKGHVMPPPTSFLTGWGWTQRSTWNSWRRWWSPVPRKPSERGHLSCSRIVHPAQSQRWISYHIFDSTSPEVWPPNSPDLNLMDFYVWGAFERDTNRTAYKTREELSTWIKALFTQLSRNQASRRCSWFRGHTKAILEARRSFTD